jgi:ATPase subunit of ABC transporter with duplicated ATPase domains
MLEKLKTEQLIEKPFARKVIPFRFPETERSGREVITIEGLTHGYGDKVGSPLTCVAGRMRSTSWECVQKGRRSPVKGSWMASDQGSRMNVT